MELKFININDIYLINTYYNIFIILYLYLFFFLIFIINHRENDNVEKSSLNFTINVEDCFENHNIIELKPNGAKIDVTDSNKNEYIK